MTETWNRGPASADGVRAPSALFLCLLTMGVKGAVPPASLRGGLWPHRVGWPSGIPKSPSVSRTSRALQRPRRQRETVHTHARRGQVSRKYIAKHDHRLLDTCQTSGALRVSMRFGDCLQSAGFLFACVGQNSHVVPLRVVRSSFRVLALKWPFRGVSEGVPRRGRLQ